MTAPVSFTIAIVSRGRPANLKRALVACSQQYHWNFEVVVVADPAGLEAIEELSFADAITVVPFDEPNIARARNRAISTARGDVVAFLDDDAVPEPMWLSAYAKCFAAEEVSAATGPVRGRNGISFQSYQPLIDRLGTTYDGRSAPKDAVSKLVGTNMAIRRDTLTRLGGFDERYRFYLEDSDLSLRLAEENLVISHCPDAQVHHGFAASERRKENRMPLRIDDIGRSAKIFLDRHAPLESRARALAHFRDEERRRLLRNMVAGACEPRDVARILNGFEDGVKSSHEPMPLLPDLRAEQADFVAFSGSTPNMEHVTVAGGSRSASQVKSKAQELSLEGCVVSAFAFGKHTLFHRVAYHPKGFWLQTGGVWGRSDRTDSLTSCYTIVGRVERELDRVKSVRCAKNVSTWSQFQWI